MQQLQLDCPQMPQAPQAKRRGERSYNDETAGIPSQPTSFSYFAAPCFCPISFPFLGIIDRLSAPPPPVNARS